jgi:hypothetical protein
MVEVQMRRHINAVVMLALFDVTCASTSTRSTAPKDHFGSPADVQTALGDHDGFVVGKCTLWERPCVFVQGKGSERILPPDAEDWTPLAMERLRKLLYVSGHSRGFGRGCRGGGVIVEVESWKMMDASIEATGTNLRLANVSDTVTLCVSSIPIAH